MRPEETLDIKLAIYERLASRASWLDSKQGAALANMAAQSYAIQGFNTSPQDELDSLRIAQNFWVSPDMVNVIEAAQETLPDDTVLLEEPPANHGFLMLAAPFTLRCDNPRCFDDHPFCGLWWRRVHRVLPVAGQTTSAVQGGLLLQWLSPAHNEREREHFGSPVVPAGAGIFLPAGRPLAMRRSIEAQAIRPESTVLSRYARTMWILMQQPLAEVKALDTPRPQRRRLKRAGQKPGPVNVVALRSSPSAPACSEQKTNVEWTHRWIVRGHWRRQWHPRLQARRPIWIHEHVKGPEDKPLVVGEKVIAWRK
ncbi:hypothetical protein ACFT8P_13525 [Streptomyces sp. NPDC057101]|uniref:hypothetical protein n=1 Tax=Streptomyces TaxID=1883 RepID=UPI0036444951